MPLDNTALLPPASRLRTVLTTIGTEIAPIFETVRYELRLPDDEPDDLVAYVEFEAPLVIVNESIQGSQRSWMPFKVLIYIYINESDSRILADLIEHVTETVMTDSAQTNYRNAFGTAIGFSVEQINIAEIGFGEEFCQAKLALEILMHHE